jgi:protein-disulfide isomerase
VAGLVGETETRNSVPNYLFAGSTVSLAAILYLAYMSFFVLKLVCILCLMTYVAVIGLFLVSGTASTEPMLSLPRRAVRDLKVLGASPLALVLSVLLAAGSGAAIMLFPREAVAGGAGAASQDQRSELERFMASAPRVPLIVSAEGAKVVIVKFNDFQCPACGQSFLSYKPILAKYQISHPGAIKVILKDYPLNPECNANVHTMLHPAACAAAVAVRLARMKGKGDEMEEWLFTHQSDMTVDTVKRAVRDFDARYAATLDLVKGDIAYGKQLAVSSTPTFFINGVKVEGAWAPQFFDQAMAYELQRAAGK